MKCGRCNEEHDISEIEPGFWRPDAFLEVPVRERRKRTLDSNDLCAVRDGADTQRRYFVRTLLPVEVSGRAKPIKWGIWAEVSEAVNARLVALWEDPKLTAARPLRAELANAITGYPSTQGIKGTIRFVYADQIPYFTVDPRVVHPFADEVRRGITEEDVLRWLAPMLHPVAAPSKKRAGAPARKEPTPRKPRARR